MKRNILFAFLCGLFLLSLTGCGTPNHEELKKSAEDLEIETLFKDMRDNVAAAEKKYDKKYYKINVSVMNIETKYFTYMYSSGNKIYSIDIFMSQEELVNLKNGSEITIIGKFDIVNDGYVKVKNGFVIS